MAAVTSVVGARDATTVGGLLVATVGVTDETKDGVEDTTMVGSALAATLGSWVGALLGSNVGRISLQIQICSLLSPHLEALEQFAAFSSTVQSLAPYPAQVAFAKLYVTSVIQTPAGVLAYE